MIDSILELKKNTDRLFYDQYSYGLKLRMKDFSCLREMRRPEATLEQAAEMVSYRFEQRCNYSRLINRRDLPTELSSRQYDLDNILNLLRLIWPVKNLIKTTFSGDWGYIYSNNKKLLQSIGHQSYVFAYYINEAVVTRPKDTIMLQNSSYQYRSFLKEQQWTSTDKARIFSYLKNQPDIKIGRGLTYWLKYDTRWPWSRRYYYFDHNDAKIELMLQLICPGIIRTTMPIIEVNS